MKKLLKSSLLAICCWLLATGSNATIKNPMLWADVPDPDVIRVGDTFYLVSTTMHLMPGAPVMASKDLENWETVGYIFDKLTDSPKYDLAFSLPLDQQKGDSQYFFSNVELTLVGPAEGVNYGSLLEDFQTGVKNVKTVNSAVYFDLQGRRVAKPTKGLYIKNNQKVVIK